MLLNKVINEDWRVAIKNVEDNSVDCVITDPPYGINYQSNYRQTKHKKIQDDDNLDWLSGWVDELKRVCKTDAHIYIYIYIYISWHKIDIFKQELERCFNVKNILVWEKNNTGMGDLQGDYAPKYELIIFCSNGNKKLNGTRDANIIKTKRTFNELHPTEKPVNLMRYLIEKSTVEGDVVLDTFAGSFSTAKACKQSGRNFICFEIEKEYCDKAKVILEGLTTEINFNNNGE